MFYSFQVKIPLYCHSDDRREEESRIPPKFEKTAFTVSPIDNILIFRLPVWRGRLHTPFTRSQTLWNGETSETGLGSHGNSGNQHVMCWWNGESNFHQSSVWNVPVNEYLCISPSPRRHQGIRMKTFRRLKQNAETFLKNMEVFWCSNGHIHSLEIYA